MKKALLALTVFLTAISLFSQSGSHIGKGKTMPINLGFYGGLNFNMHAPNFRLLATDPITGDTLFDKSVLFNKNSTTLGGNFGLIGNFPIDDMFVITGRLGYNMANGQFKDSSGFNTITTSLSYFEITPGVEIYNLFPVDGLYLLGGLEIGVPIDDNYKNEYNSVLKDTTTFNTSITNVNTRVALVLGAGITFEIGDNIYLSPEASLRIPFSKVSNVVWLDSWNVTQLRIGANLTFGVGSNKKEKTSDVEPGNINVGFDHVYAYDRNGKKSEATKVTLEEVQYTELFPLLNYVFYSKNSSTLAPNTQDLYAQNQSGKFTIESLDADAMAINSHTLDIIGTRMQKSPSTTIKITGTTDGKDEGTNKELAQSRADFAKNYLVENYGINTNRIKTDSRALPAKPSSSSDPDGIEENRRAEINPESANSNLLDPIMIERDKQRLATPDVIEFVPYAKSVDSIGHWELTVKQSGRTLKEFSGSGKPGPIQWSITPNELEAGELPIDYNFSAETVNGKDDDVSGTLPVEFISISRKKTEDRPDKTISKFSLTLFDFNSPEISPKDKDIIDKYIIPAIKYNSTVQIYGYTDRIGAEDYNKKLASQRGDNVMNYLKSKMKDVKYEVYGVGETVQVYDNNIATGRQLSRTVQVYVITPKN